MALTTFKKIELIVGGIIFGLFNNISTIWNAKVLFENDQISRAPGALTIFFLLFPGIVTSIGFLVLHWRGSRRFGKLPPFSVLLYFLVLLFCYPAVPISLCIYTLYTGQSQTLELAVMTKMFEGFLDDGPQFVLRLVVVVLFGIHIGQGKDDVIFIMSMVTSFGAVVYFGLKFNERQTNALVKWLLAFPMFAASVAARAFTLAVFLKETLDNKSEWFGAIVLLGLYIGLNVLTFKLCRQDWVRSFLFGFSSTLIPVGYNNDPNFYQCPDQAIADEDGKYAVSPAGEQIDLDRNQESQNHGEDTNPEKKMKSGHFLIAHTIINTALLSSCAIYISLTRDLSVESEDALVLPQVLAVIPGCFFTLARSVLLIERGQPCKVWAAIKTVLAVVFGLIAYGSLIPALFGSFIWKIASFLD